MLVMSFVYFNIWQIRLIRPGPFETAMVGFSKDVEKNLMSASSPFVFSAVSERSVLRFLAALTAPAPLSAQTATLNSSQAPGRPWIDLGLQLVFVLSLLLPVLLVLYLLRRSDDPMSVQRSANGVPPPAV